jgi:hypothetical protein
MSLFKTTAEIKKYLAVNINTKFESIKPDIDQVEESIIKNYLSPEQYLDLHTKYNGSTPLGTDDQKLLEKVQLPLINLAYAKYLPLNQVRISDAGVQIASTTTEKTAWEWQIRDLIEGFNQKGFDGLEALLSFLEENKATYTLWAGSDSYTEFKQYFINSAKEFDKYYKINKSRLSYLSLESIIKKVEDFSIKPALGTDFFKEIKAKIKAGTAFSEEEQEVIDLMNPAIAHLTIAKACTELRVEFKGNSFVVHQFATAGTKSNPAGDEMIFAKRKQAEIDGNAYLKDLVDFLNKKASETKYATYFNSDKYIAPADGDGGVFNNDDPTKKIYFA